METFIQPKITGYRQLTADEAALMNEGKALAEQCGAYIAKLRGYVPKDVNKLLPYNAYTALKRNYFLKIIYKKEWRIFLNG